jgi:hypothetical protein
VLQGRDASELASPAPLVVDGGASRQPAAESMAKGRQALRLRLSTGRPSTPQHA